MFDRLDERDQILLRQAIQPPSKSSESPTPESEIIEVENNKLPCGNYLLVVWDCLAHKGQMLQLGAYMPVNQSSLIQTIKPEGSFSLLAGISHKRLAYTKDFQAVTHPCLNIKHPLKPLKAAIAAFLDTIERGLSCQRPVFDGALLVCQYEDDITALIKAVRKTGLETRFNTLVKGMGDLKSFVNEHYPKYLYYVESKAQVSGGEKWSDTVSIRMSELIERLVGKKN